MTQLAPLARLLTGCTSAVSLIAGPTASGAQITITGVNVPVVGVAAPQQHLVRFTDVTFDAGIHHLQREVTRDCLIFAGGGRCEMEFMSGGAAAADVDGDGWVDLFVTRIDGPDALYKNLGGGMFVDIAAQIGLGAPTQSNGAAFGDIDNDGDQDLFVTTIANLSDPQNAHHRLWINDGAGHFTEEGLARGAAILSAGAINGWSPTFGDYDRDGWLDLSVTQWHFELDPRGRLLRGVGATQPGHFTDVTMAAGVSIPGVSGFATAFVDLDSDGFQDLAIAGDFGSSQLFFNRADGTFVEMASAAGVGTDENGMGSTFGDIDRDGDLDWFVSSIFDPQSTCATLPCNWGDTGNRMYVNGGNRVFADVTDTWGVREGGWGWGSAFLDFDNDGHLDLIETNGVRFNTPIISQFVRDTTMLWRGDGRGSMQDWRRAAGLFDTGSGKGLLTFDYDRDGDQDVFIVQNSGYATLLRNDGGNKNAWIRVSPRGVVSNRDAIGARVRLWRTGQSLPEVQEIGVGSHFLGQSERVAHFGLGRGATLIPKIEVEFPLSGTTKTFINVAPNQVLVVDEQ